MDRKLHRLPSKTAPDIQNAPSLEYTAGHKPSGREWQPEVFSFQDFARLGLGAGTTAVWWAW
jgi:hypothetical protein